MGVPGPGLWHLTRPGAALCELKWALMLRRAAVVTVEQHAAAVAGQDRRSKGIEEVIGCGLCGARRAQPLFHAQDRKRDPPRWNYHVVRCPTCGLLYRHPGIRADRLGDLYARGYSKFLGGRYRRERQRRYRLVMDAFAPLFADGAERRLLDFGCGTGLFLRVVHERGFDCHGVDLAADSIEAARRRPGGEMTFVGAPTDAPAIAAGGFDVITMWSVLAHLAEPVQDVTMLRRLLAPDGVLLILTVNANSLRLKRDRAGWGGFTPNHLKFFSPTTLPALLARAGFGAVVMRPMYGDAIETGASRLSPDRQRTLCRVVDRGNRGNMLRAVAFADPDGPGPWGMADEAMRLGAVASTAG